LKATVHNQIGYFALQLEVKQQIIAEKNDPNHGQEVKK
jgi:hypothetical protein